MPCRFFAKLRRRANLNPLSALAKGSSVEVTDMRLFDRRTREPYVQYAI
jgi:hypothetical protein